MVDAREGHQAILLPDGQVLIAGGLDSGSGGQASTEVYDPATGMWSLDAPSSTAPVNFGLTLLADGRVLRSGGWSGDDSVADAEVYDLGLSFDPAWRPSLAVVTSPLLPGSPLTIAGSGLRGHGLTEASSGTNSSSATNYPLVQLRRVDNGQVRWLLPDPGQPFSATAFTALPVAGLPGGPYLVTVFVNGIASVSQMITVSETDLAPIAHDDAYATDQDLSLLVAAPGVLTNDLDGDLPIQTLTAALDTGPVHGDLVLNSDGSFLYTPDQNFYGADDFSYTVSDGELDSTAVVSLTVRATGEPGLADLALAKTASAAKVRPGAALTYTLVLTNTGPSDSTAITVTDWLPPAASLIAASPDCLATGHVVTCLPSSLPAGVTATLTMTVRVNVTATGILSNTALVSTAEPDPEPANNRAWAAVQVVDFYMIYLPILLRGGE
jgi:uncharacterized repeat protein (TIGR01451 family)